MPVSHTLMLNARRSLSPPCCPVSRDACACACSSQQSRPSKVHRGAGRSTTLPPRAPRRPTLQSSCRRRSSLLRAWLPTVVVSDSVDRRRSSLCRVRCTPSSDARAAVASPRASPAVAHSAAASRRAARRSIRRRRLSVHHTYSCDLALWLVMPLTALTASAIVAAAMGLPGAAAADAAAAAASAAASTCVSAE